MTVVDAWSWVTAAVSLLGAWVGGRSPRWGWVYSMGCQAVWIADGVVTGQHGMIALSVAFIGFDFYNLWRWRGTRFTPTRKKKQDD